MLIAQACVEGCGPEEAARRIAERLDVASRGAPDWASAHHGAAMPADALRDALGAALSRAAPLALHGAGSCLGVMSSDGTFIAEGDGAGVLAIWDPSGDYGVGVRAFAGDPRVAGATAARRAMIAAERDGEAPDLVWISASPGAEEQVLAGIQDALGATTPIVGGSAADNDVSGGWAVFDAKQSMRDGVVVSALYPSTPIAHAFQSGYAPTGASGRVTRAEGRTVFEIDGRPARAVFAEWTGGAVVAPEGPEAAILAASSWSPLGRATESVAGVPFHLLAHPAVARADGGLDLFAVVREGDVLEQMSGSPESLKSRAGRIARSVMEDERIGGQAAGALVVFCGGSMLAMRDRMEDVVAGLRDALGATPFLGVFTFGEQGPSLSGENLHGNLMISCTALGSR
jgi:hypothetical protein